MFTQLLLNVLLSQFFNSTVETDLPPQHLQQLVQPNPNLQLSGPISSPKPYNCHLLIVPPPTNLTPNKSHPLLQPQFHQHSHPYTFFFDTQATSKCQDIHVVSLCHGNFAAGHCSKQLSSSTTHLHNISKEVVCRCRLCEIGRVK